MDVINVEILTKEFKGDEAKAQRVFHEICMLGGFGMLHLYATLAVGLCTERVKADIEQLIAAEKEKPKEGTPPKSTGYVTPPPAPMPVAQNVPANEGEKKATKPKEAKPAKKKGRGRPRK